MSKHMRLATRSETFDKGPPIFFSHNDVVCSTSHELARLGMGALRASLEAVFKALTGKELVTTAYGKPQIGTFQFATRLLQQWRKDVHGINSPPEIVYSVGDTPESDIRGTNKSNESPLSENEWYSVLVGTVVYRQGTTPAFGPKASVKNVLNSVNYGLQREVTKVLKAKILAATKQSSEAIEVGS
ncbi:hypothetical protein MMC13_001193 [Lambiella insularis]|nr:hypothetical protein [Lambiella insularis]